MIYDVMHVRGRPGTTPVVLQALERWLAAQSEGKLVACWYSELGPVNRVLLLRTYDDVGALHAHRERAMAETNPYGIAEHATGIESDAFAQCAGVPAPASGTQGPWFEVRDYRMHMNGLAPLLELWRPVLPARLALAPVVTAMYALSGRMPRLLHIYPWPSLEERARVRGAARGVGWPPAGVHAHIAEQETTVYLAAPFSPLN